MDSVVYFMQREDNDIKIGVTLSRRLQIRFDAHRKQHGDLVFLGCIEGSYCEEEELHHRFKYCRRTLPSGRYTEWFSPSPELLDFINNIESVVPSEKSAKRFIYEEGECNDWIAVPEFTDYQINSYGQVRSRHVRKLLSPHSSHGRTSYWLYRGGKKYQRSQLALMKLCFEDKE